jgi:GT2 family glycosyltransferase/SAM-dependent methyltransferase
MSVTSELVRINKLDRTETGLWVPGRASEDDFGYSDGDSTEDYLVQVLESASDVSSTSAELESHIRDWPSEYHLRALRANLLRPFEFAGGGPVLELGCGFGAITRYLGERGFAVDAVEGSLRRARGARARCRDLDRVEIAVADFNTLALPGRHYRLALLVGVLEYAAMFTDGALSPDDAAATLLGRLADSIADDGVVLVAIENRFGLKYLLGANEDHAGVPYVGIHGYPGITHVRTWSRERLEVMAREAGFEALEFYYPFPDYKLPTLQLREGYVRGDPWAWSHLLRMRSRDGATPMQAPIDEAMFWEAAVGNGSLGDFANSFCLLLSRSACAIQAAGGFDFAHMPEAVRGRSRSVMTRKASGVDRVVKSPIDPQGEAVRVGPIRQQLGQEPYLRGPLLATEWLRCLRVHADAGVFDDALRRYHEWLRERLRDPANANRLDMIPSNIIVDEAGEYHFFDDEWQVSAPSVDVVYAYYRGLFSFAVYHRSALARYAVLRGLRTVQDFIEHGFRLVGEDYRTQAHRLTTRELAFQRALDEAFPAGFFDEAMALELAAEYERTRFTATVYWSDADPQWVEARSVRAQGRIGGERQQLRFAFDVGDQAVNCLRLDPCDHTLPVDAGYLHLHRLTVTVDPGEGERTMVDLRGGEAIAAGVELGDMRWHQGPLGELFEVWLGDPHFVLRLPEPVVAGTVRVMMELDWPRTPDFLTARDTYLKRETQLQQRLRLLESASERAAWLESELSVLRGSRLWRAAESVRWVAFRAVPGLIRRALRLVGLERQAVRWLLPLTRRAPAPAPAPGVESAPQPQPDGTERTEYQRWMQANGREHAQLLASPPDLSGLARRPRVSIVMPVHNTPVAWLSEAVESVRRQSYGNWELCVVNDASTDPGTLAYLRDVLEPRIRVRHLPQGRNIAGATNEAISLATGEYIGFLDHDDVLSPDALYEVVLAINSHDPDLVYSDEDFLDPRIGHTLPFFKPDWSPDLLLSHNYITHFVVMKRDLLDRAGWLDSRFDGAQDYDLLLRASEHTDRIHHIPKVLYHWRRSPQSTSGGSAAKPYTSGRGRAALEQALCRRGIDAVVDSGVGVNYFRVRRPVPEPAPKVSIVIPFRDQPELLGLCLDSIRERCCYRNLEVVGVSNNTTSPATFELMERFSREDSRIRFVELNEPFNFSRLVNHGVSRSEGDHVLLLNNDIELLSWEAVEAMLEHSMRPEVGAVGGKLYYPDDTIQHAGIVVGLGGYAGHGHKHFPANAPGYFNRLNVVHNVAAVTGACLMTRREVYESLGGFDEEAFGVAYNDVDYCLRLLDRGLRVIFTPYAEAYHHESLSRGYEDTPEKAARFEREKAGFRARHGRWLERGDPFYNPNLSPSRDDFSLRW